MIRLRFVISVFCAVVFCPGSKIMSGAELVGTILDADTRRPIEARVYVQDAAGNWSFVESADERGSALPYREQWVPMPDAVELHTTVSAHPFRTKLEPGQYTVTIERGKEYQPLTQIVTVGEEPLRKTFLLQRWIDMAGRGWYSGETHVHRRVRELPNVMLAEDLNVAFPVTFWTVNAGEAPHLQPSRLRRQGPSPFGPRIDYGTDMIAVDAQHVIFPRNTEYEVFFVDGKRHTLGAVFILNHQSRFTGGMPPVAEIAERAHREGALLDLDKHSWPWAMMLVPVAKVDLFELANNSVWRTKFGFRRSATAPAYYMGIEADEHGMTEWGWLDFGFQNYYALLNCGFHLQPTAGTASGVHPVPLGYSRVYVYTGKQFDPDRWLDGLRRGESFVTNGPMLLATLADQRPGHRFALNAPRPEPFRLRIEAVAPRPLDRVEVIVNGRIVASFRPTAETSAPEKNPQSPAARAFRWQHEVALPLDESSWVAVRCFHQEPDGRTRFAHTAPWHVQIAGEPVRPRAREVEFLIRRVRDEITRNENVLSEAALNEFREALKEYERILPRAVDED